MQGAASSSPDWLSVPSRAEQQMELAKCTTLDFISPSQLHLRHKTSKKKKRNKEKKKEEKKSNLTVQQEFVAGLDSLFL